MLIPIGLNDRRALPALLSPPSSVRTKGKPRARSRPAVRVRLAVKSCAEVTVQPRCDVVALPRGASASTHTPNRVTGPHQGLHKRTRCREALGAASQLRCMRQLSRHACVPVAARKKVHAASLPQAASAASTVICVVTGPIWSADGRHVSSTVLADELTTVHAMAPPLRLLLRALLAASASPTVCNTRRSCNRRLCFCQHLGSPRRSCSRW